MQAQYVNSNEHAKFDNTVWLRKKNENDRLRLFRPPEAWIPPAIQSAVFNSESFPLCSAWSVMRHVYTDFNHFQLRLSVNASVVLNKYISSEFDLLLNYFQTFHQTHPIIFVTLSH